MSGAAVEGRADTRIHRRVEHVMGMGMPISLAMRGRYAATPEADRAWQSVINQLREVDQVFSTYREDSVINRLDRGELAPEQCPAEVATAAYLHGRDAVRWLQDRPIRSAFIVWLDGTTTRLPADLNT